MTQEKEGQDVFLPGCAPPSISSLLVAGCVLTRLCAPALCILPLVMLKSGLLSSACAHGPF